MITGLNESVEFIIIVICSVFAVFGWSLYKKKQKKQAKSQYWKDKKEGKNPERT